MICKDSILILNTFSPANLPIHIDFKGLNMYDGQVYVRIVQNRDLVSLEFNIKAKFIGNSQEVDFNIEIGTEGMSENLHAPILLIMY